ncbi:phage virion morphogenesis protein [Acinetobacter sp. V102_4]|uniref:phage virion morphogenesis protein n=1 Tax=Acinetobacter sp. V102_4 TaxID=3072984 RepID=UPI00287C31E7|nr:phage virion morphogenesis protein [Acinetobacter sp. V102_4]MDS7929618.1 phage virion morphogenesis protein [Acinetobacter sp. V102_4]
MSVLQIKDDEVRQKLNQAAQRLVNTEPLTADLERVLVSQSLQNFHANGRPKWAGLSPVTLAKYRKQGIKPQGILQRSPGGLRDSVQGDHDMNSVTIGAGSGKSAAYAPIHQFSGMAGRKRKVKIPARPYLPMNQQGFLQAEAENAVSFVASHYLSTLFD